MDDPAGTPITPAAATVEASTQPPELSRPDTANRYLTLQLLAILFIVGGIAGVALVVIRNPWVFNAAQPGTTSQQAGIVLVGVVLSGLAFLLGLALHIGRSLVVREGLPPDRYRGPSLIVLLMLAVIAANFASLSVVSDILNLSQGRAPSIYGSVVALTVTQAGLVAATALFVAAPRALAGLRLVPLKGIARAVGLGLVFAIPAWIGASLVALIVTRLLELIGVPPDQAITETAIRLVDPVVLVVAIVIVAPVAEEVFFRGVVYNAWLREYGPRRALIGSAALFALIHGSVFALLPIFGLGLALAMIYRWTGSLASAIAMHAAFNGLSLAIGLLERFKVIQLP